MPRTSHDPLYLHCMPSIRDLGPFNCVLDKSKSDPSRDIFPSDCIVDVFYTQTSKYTFMFVIRWESPSRTCRYVCLVAMIPIKASSPKRGRHPIDLTLKEKLGSGNPTPSYIFGPTLIFIIFFVCKIHTLIKRGHEKNPNHG